MTGGAPGSDSAAAGAQPADGAPARPPSTATDIEEGVAAHLEGFLAACDRIVTGLSRALETARAADPVDEVELGVLEGQLVAATELVDLLESAVSVVVRRVEPRREGAPGTAPPGTRMDTV